MSTKSRDETEEWIMALQAILIQVVDSLELQTEKINEDCDSEYDQPLEHIKKKDLQSRMETIQGRNLPSLPPTEQENNPQQLQKTGKVNGKMATLFRFRGQSSSSEEEQSNKRQSIDSITSATDDVYQELPSPAASATPYSSVENLKHSMEDIYNSVEDVGSLSTHDLSTNKSSAISPVRGGNIHHSRSLSDGLVTWPNAPPEDLPVYDIPSPTIRPLSTLSILSDEGGSNGTTRLKNHQKDAKIGIVFHLQARKQFSSGSLNVVSDGPEVYDVPVTNPRRVSITENENEALLAYDRVTTPPRTVNPPSEVNSTPPPPPTPATKKIARYWQEKISQVDKPLNNFKKDSSPPTKCLPKPSTVEKVMPLAEIKSVGRCFSRTSPQRAPLASLTELLASTKNGVDVQIIKPSALKTNVANINGSLIGIKVGSKQGNTSLSTFNHHGVKASNIGHSSSNKKEPPPRPPAPVRPPLAIKAGESMNLADELNRKLMKRVIKNGEVAEEQPTTEPKNRKDSIVTTFNKTMNVKEQYKARWAYVATNSFELSINSGEIVQVLSKSGANWLVQAKNKKGLVPQEYLVPLASKVLSLTKVGEAPITV